jgi:hypothetical protein
MATVTEERDALKITLNNPKRAADKFTIVNHSDGSTTTCSGIEAYRLMNSWIDKGRGGETIHLVDHRKEKASKLAPGTRTRFSLECGSNELYRQIAGEWERILAQVKNVTVARHIVAETVLDALRMNLTATKIVKRMSEGEGEIPDWMR